MMNSAISVQDLAISRGGRAVLRDVSFDVPAGTIYGLLGPSGCGKSTLMRAIVGVQRYSGQLQVLGEPAGSAILRGQIGYVSQAPSVYGDLTVVENLRYFASMVGAAASQVHALVDDVGLSEQASQLVRELSGGQCARVSLAAALLGNPVLLVLDEPTVGVDPVLRRDLWAMFAELAAGGTTLFISSHVMDEAQRCERLMLLRGGRVLVAGCSPAQLLTDTGADDVEGAFLRLVEQGETGAAA
ncbi:MAG: ABC transporter ATP-binding protein [Mycobacteriaceae bacterium]